MGVSKNLIFGTLLFGINTIVAFLLLLCFALPYMSPKSFPNLSLLSLVVSPLLLLNALFAVYWILKFKKRFWLSFLILVVAFFHFNGFIAFSSDVNPNTYSTSLNVLSYNVRLFNSYENTPDLEAVASSFNQLLAKQHPDVICIQEYYRKNQIDFSSYPYQYIHFRNESAVFGHAIFSKVPILDKGSFDFPDTYNNAQWVDLNVGEDTVRVYNVHLQSLGILPSVDFLQQRGQERIRERLRVNFIKQQDQVELLMKHSASISHASILMGDFNNTAFSYSYHRLKEGRKDAFKERGNGLGTTFSFNGYPMRIDFILPSKHLEVTHFETLKRGFSDHHPINATVAWR